MCLGALEGQWTSAADACPEPNEPDEAKHISADLGRKFSVTNSDLIVGEGSLTPCDLRFPWEGSRKNEEGKNKKIRQFIYDKFELLIPKRNY